ncbi:Retrovirus-related Pol polyprotein from transposon TNT 1-94 [Dendrobium catenatum]|uniref:Retrovirus-related Pol polyprotein from transposon TNT 1-94 n=1 Tax=Dendrobium catenatum TaxID=906689 RepID=A0A2I0VAY3_9ASPA|nr:Retrovirus-related Pol polyprotein from transposon TNT 1-94 [Dendrobium catenatum]
MTTSLTASPSVAEQLSSTTTEIAPISPSLKFVVSNLKTLVPNQLSSDNYPIWRHQIIKLLRANDFDNFLAPPVPPIDPSDPSAAATLKNWRITDQNLQAALCSTISPPVLPYILHLDTTHEIWQFLENQFQAASRSKVIQLKNELHHISMKNLSMVQYLTEIKKLVDQIASAGSTIDSEDIILYIFNGLPPAYQSFKTYIRNSPTQIRLDNLYAMLISEKIHITADAARSSADIVQQAALYANRGRGRRNRGQPPPPQSSNGRSVNQQQSAHICQICAKKGHTADVCWHRMNANYTPQSSTAKQNNALVANSDTPSYDWYLDSGASSHMTNAADNLTQATTYPGSDGVFIGDGRNIPIAHSGTSILPTPTRKLFLSNLLHVPDISHNLISISNLVQDNNISVTFDPMGFVFKDLTTNQPLLRGPCSAGLYRIVPPSTAKSPTSAFQASNDSRSHWHDRLGHPNSRMLHQIAQSNPTLRIMLPVNSCTTCIQCKCHKLPFQVSRSRTKFPLVLLHADVWGPAPVPSPHGIRYFLILVDDYSRYTWLFSLSNKSFVYNVFKQFITFIENQTNRRIKALRTDNGTEFVNHQMNELLRSNGIRHQLSYPYTPEQNGVVERKNRHILETTRSLLHRASIPHSFWPEASSTAVYLINRMPSPNTQNKSPLQLMFNISPEYKHLRTFGCECFPLLTKHEHNKLQPKSCPFVFMGYSDVHKGYKCINKDSQSIVISHNVTFLEDSFPFKTNHSSPQLKINEPPFTMLLPTSKASKACLHHIVSPPQISAPLRSPSPPSLILVSTAATDHPSNHHQQQTIPPPHKHPMVTRTQTGSIKPPRRLNLLTLRSSSPESDPTNFKDASKHHEWRQAMTEEFTALQQQGTWQLVPPPLKEPILGCKWTFRKKFNSDGSIAPFKARLVAQGNQQEHDIDFGETFSPVSKLPTIRVLFTIALSHGWPVQQLDVSNAFLHGLLTDTVYMSQPRGFVNHNYPNYVCRLQKLIYGLRQAPRQWYTTFTQFLLTIGFEYSKANPSLLTLHQNQTRIFLLFYVDDILVTGNNDEAISTVLTKLHSKFNMKNLGPAHHFLDIKIQSLKDKYFLSQSYYALSILNSVNLADCNPLSNPSCTKLPDQVPEDVTLS